MFSRSVLRRLGPVYSSSVRGLKGRGTIVDSELGTLHLSTEDDQPSQTNIQGSFSSKLKEDLNPYESSGPGAGVKKERSLNITYLLGRVGNDPVMRGSTEKPVTVFSLATNTMWKTVNPGPADEEWSHRTDWHNVAVFKKGLREYAYNVVSKGARIHIQGKILYGEVTDSAGIRRQTTTIVADDIILINSTKTR